jgi:hypothetical protein
MAQPNPQQQYKMRPRLQKAARELRRIEVQPCQCHICTLIRIEDRSE